MVLDYSKWDKIELSDDSDIEVHPNVDKRSFINAMARKKREERALRKQQIQHYATEIGMNTHLLKKLDALIANFRNASNRTVEEVVMNALMELTSTSDSDAPEPPAGAPSYANMLAALVDTVKKEVDERQPSADAKLGVFIERLEAHRAELQRQTELTGEKKAKLEAEERSKITSDDLHEGFSAGHINKSKPVPKPKEKTKVQVVEQLNAPGAGDAPQSSSGADADAESAASDSEDTAHEPSELGKAFSRIPVGHYTRMLEYIREHPDVVHERETDGLLITAFNAQLEGDSDTARRCVHHALLLQYCRSLGRDGVGLFFKRITTPNHQAQTVFAKDVAETYARIRERAGELAKREKQPVEQIQLHAVDPGTRITINIPEDAKDGEEKSEERKIFEGLPPGLQRALQGGSLDEVNKVLGKMSVEEAEEVVGKLGEAGMLSLEEGIVDATTEEGRKKVEELERARREGREEGEAAGAESSGGETEKGKSRVEEVD